MPSRATVSSFALTCLLIASCGRVGFDATALTGDGGGPPDDDAAGATVDAMPPPVLGLVAAWELNEGSGQVAAATVGTDAVLGRSSASEAVDPMWDGAGGCTGSALTFDGANDVVTIPGPSTADLSAFTIAFSLVVTGNGGGNLPRIVTKEDGGVPDTIVHIRSAADAIAINMFNQGNTLFATFGEGVVTGERASWAVVFDDAGDRRVHVYKDGIETTYLRQDTMTGTLRTTEQPWQLGNQATGVRALDGTLDAVRIYDRALAPAEIAALSATCVP